MSLLLALCLPALAEPVTPLNSGQSGPGTGGSSGPGGGSHQDDLDQVKRAHQKMSAAELVDKYKSSPGVRVAASHGFTTDAGAELVQSLGQIVATRASQQGFAQIKAAVLQGLQCDGQPLLPKTCDAVDALRLEDIAADPTALLDAVVQDLVGLLLQTTGLDADAFLHRVVGEIVVPALVAQTTSNEGFSAALVAEDVLDGLLESTDAGTDKQKTTLIAAAAVARCRLEGQGADCPIGEFVRSAGTDLDPTRTVNARARQLAWHVHLASAKGKTSPEDRFQHATDAMFMVARLEVDAEYCQGDEPADDCAAIQMAQDLIGAAVSRDTNGLVVAGLKVIEAALKQNEQDLSSRARRALRLVGGLLAYAETYSDSNDDTEAAHKARTAVLESLTKDLTVRTEREGDWIVGLGGSLRVGGSTSLTGDAVQGPVLLPLGLSVGRVPQKKRVGFLLSFSALDIGRYLTWSDEEGSEAGLVVGKPDIADSLELALRPGITYGNPGAPFVVGPDVSYTPVFDSDSDETADFRVGLSLGVHVPLLDFN